eukprot:CAMPEP_0184296016 /NCGR_PEP_ID=MMETSP1049-20130417/6971_1 /TAXON_ID=77928 /ORGANISM="Proteomonas sulcata, Strain CCMP704" /LENGTH=36 /DNA_ID= /DNA_START= /DNA_END= /DNA_ORIENTATION=
MPYGFIVWVGVGQLSHDFDLMTWSLEQLGQQGCLQA